MAIGLYDPAYEHDACGVGMVADLHGRADHSIVDRGLTVLERLAHRGASGAEVETGDGAGILVQMPHRFLAAAATAAGFALPESGGVHGGACLPARRRGRRAEGPGHGGATGGRGGPRRARVARRADGAGRAGEDRARGDAPDRAGVPGTDRRCRRRSHGLGAAGLRAAQAGGARSRRPLLPVALGTHHRLQGHAHVGTAAPSSSPTCATPRSSRDSRWFTPASPPIPFRAGRWPTRTGTWPTTGRSTRWPATGTGCGPVRRCSRPS